MTRRHLIRTAVWAAFLLFALAFVTTNPSAQSGTFTSVNVATGLNLPLSQFQ